MFNFLQDNQNFFLPLSIILGALLGSFITMLSYRLPKIFLNNQSAFYELLYRTRSYCPHCQKNIPFYHNIPILSWFFLKGKCHNCKTSISFRYPFIEILVSIFTGLIFYYFGFTDKGFALFFLFIMLTLISVIDFETHYIFDIFSIPLIWLGLILNLNDIFVSIGESIFGAILGYLFLWNLYHVFKVFSNKEGMGYGDFKLMSAIGAWFGVFSLPKIMIISGILFLLYAFYLKIRDEKYDKNDELPLGPFISMASIIYVFTFVS